jgi:cob(I)alamin adenosyltransferase
MNEAGKIHIYTGEGKGKSTAAAGLAARALGAGLKVLFIQFVKDGSSSELALLKTHPAFTCKAAGLGRFIRRGGLTAEDQTAAAEGFALALDALKSAQFDLIALDEIFAALSYGLVSEAALVAALKERAVGTEVVLTGRNPPQALLDLADLTTEMRCVKHYFKSGRRALKGIEF